MAFLRWGRTERPTGETLGLLKSRLDSATYEEDKLDALSELYDQSLDKPAEVGACCLSSLVKSMGSMDDISYQEKIMENAFRTQLKNELVSKLCEDRENIAVFTKRSPLELSRLLDSVDSEKFYKFLAQDLEIVGVIVLLLRSGCLQNVRKFLQSEKHLCSRVVFEGFLEIVLERLTLLKGNKAKVVELNEHYSLLLWLLEASIGNQDYFVRADLVQIMVSPFPITEKDIEIFSTILNPLSKVYETAQQRLCAPEIIMKALEVKMYEFISRIFDGNNEIFDLLLEKYLNFAVLLEDSEDSIAALGILENILRSSVEIPAACSDRIMSCKSYRICTLLHSLGFENFDMHEILDQDLRHGRVTLDLVIFVILTRDTIEDIAQYLNFQLFEGNVSDMCLLLYLLHGANLKIASTEVRSRMIRLRKFLCQEKVAVDSINEMLIGTVGEAIKEYMRGFPKKGYSIKQTGAVHHGPGENVQPENESFNGVNSRIKGLLSIFRQKDSGEQSFDL